ncbi:MAG: hypothetical protein KBA71_05360 [Opitutaceae bacterium]|nr:hypothetical protein [Opitutaceae bacterium]
MARQKNVCLEAGPADSVAHRSTHMFLQAGRHARPVRKTRGPEKNVLAFKPIGGIPGAVLHEDVVHVKKEDLRHRG